MHSYQCHRYHIVFATKDRLPVLTPDIEAEVWRYLVGVGKEKNIKIYEVGGVEDHVHILCGIPGTKLVVDAVQELKGNSSRWMKQHFGYPDMGWQTGYASFTSCVSAMDKTIHYIQNQRLHHTQESFDNEMARILSLHEKAETHLL